MKWKPEDLLAHADFVDSLSYRLVRDSDISADVAQQAWMAALENPPRSAESVRFWFSRVIRNVAARFWRTEARRSRREQSAASPDSVLSAADVVERAELRNRVVDTVLGLKEPYRSTILLRFYEDIPPHEIAENEGISAATVRTRLKRGLEQLRLKLDGEFGDRGAWFLAIAPLAGMKVLGGGIATASAGSSLTACAAAGETAGVSTSSTAALSGGVVMAAKAKLGLAAIILAGTAFIVWQMISGDPGGAPPAEELSSLQALQESRANVPEHESSMVMAEAGSPDLVSLEAQSTFLSGRVVDKVTEAPVEAFEIKLTRYENGEFGKDEPVRELISDEDGRFHIPLLRGGDYYVLVQSHRYCAEGIRDLSVPDSGGLSDYVIRLDPGFSISGQVVDDEKGKPVAGALVSSSEPWALTNFRELVLGNKERMVHTWTDDQGKFDLVGLKRTASAGSIFPQSVVVIHDDYAQGWEPFVPGETESIEIRLKKGFHIFGQALDDEGNPRSNLIVQVRCDSTPLWLYTLTDENGCFRTTALRPGYVAVRARIRADRIREESGFTVEEHCIKVIDRDIEVNFGPRPEHVTWRGVLFGPAGRPESRAYVSLFRKDANWQRSRLAGAGKDFSFHTDEEGRFDFCKLLPGRYSVSLILSDKSTFKDEAVIVFDKPGLKEKDIRIGVGESGEESDEYTAEISGVVIDGSTGEPFALDRKVGVRARWGQMNSRQTEVDGEGRFKLENLPAATYRLSVYAAKTPGKDVRGIRLEKGRKRDDLRIVVPPGGELEVKLTGFGKEDPRIFTLGRRHSDGTRFHDIIKHLESDGTWEQTWLAKTGSWTVSLTLDGLGECRKSAEIRAGELSLIVIDRKDLKPMETTSPDQGITTLAGSLSRPDGTPMAGKIMGISAYDVEGIERGTLVRRVTTDDDGLFAADGLQPGKWIASLLAADDDRALWSRHFTIPVKPDNPHELRLIVPEGTVSGTLVNGVTGDALEGEDFAWVAKALKAGTYIYWSKAEGPTPDGRFTVLGVPEEDCYVSVMATGFWRYESKAFHHPGAGDIDLGRVMLDPCGVLKLVVKNPEGDPITPCLVYLDGCREFPDKKRLATDGILAFDSLQFGMTRLEIKSLGFRSWEEFVDLPPGKPLELEIILERQ